MFFSWILLIIMSINKILCGYRHHNEMVLAYGLCGYELIEVPFGSVDERVNFILAEFEIRLISC